jgi:hypothetical protein
MPILLLLLVTLLPAAAAVALDANWAEPHLLRRDALLEGRPFEYNSEAFVKRFGYRHQFADPRPGTDGIRGTGGSVTSDRLFLDMQLTKTLRFDDARQEFFFSMQRTEDFDGSYDRQLIGLAHRLRDDLRVAVIGDVPAGKGDADLYFEGRWDGGDHRLLRAVVAFTDVLHDKRGAGEYRDRPVAYFLQARHGAAERWQAEASVNHVPRATLVEPSHRVQVGAEQSRAMLRGRIERNAWLLDLRAEGERAERTFRFDREDMPPTDDFRRRMHALTVAATYTAHRLQPEVGARSFVLRERGWSGAARAVRYGEWRDERLVYLRARVATGARQQLTPTLYLAHVDVVQQVERGHGRVRDEREWQATLALPWSYAVDPARGGMLTVNLTVDLHEGWFGGGNVQLHWPL